MKIIQTLLISYIFGQDCPTTLPQVDNGVWDCNGYSDRSRCDLTCNTGFVFNGDRSFQRCRCNKKDVCTWRPNQFEGECQQQTTTASVSSSFPTTSDLATVQTTRTSSTTITTLAITSLPTVAASTHFGSTSEADVKLCPILDYSNSQLSVVEHKGDSWISQVKIYPRQAIGLSVWSAVLIFDEPIDTMTFNIYDMDMVEQRGNILVVKSSNPEQLNESKSFVFETHGSDHIIGAMVGFYSEEIQSCICVDYTPNIVYTTSRTTRSSTTRSSTTGSSRPISTTQSTTAEQIETTQIETTTRTPFIPNDCVLHGSHSMGVTPNWWESGNKWSYQGYVSVPITGTVSGGWSVEIEFKKPMDSIQFWSGTVEKSMTLSIFCHLLILPFLVGNAGYIWKFTGNDASYSNQLDFTYIGDGVPTAGGNQPIDGWNNHQKIIYCNDEGANPATTTTVKPGQTTTRTTAGPTTGGEPMPTNIPGCVDDLPSGWQNSRCHSSFQQGYCVASPAQASPDFKVRPSYNCLI